MGKTVYTGVINYVKCKHQESPVSGTGSLSLFIVQTPHYPREDKDEIFNQSQQLIAELKTNIWRWSLGCAIFKFYFNCKLRKQSKLVLNGQNSILSYLVTPPWQHLRCHHTFDSVYARFHVIPFRCAYKPQQTNIFKFSEIMRPKMPLIKTDPLKNVGQFTINNSRKCYTSSVSLHSHLTL